MLEKYEEKWISWCIGGFIFLLFSLHIGKLFLTLCILKMRKDWVSFSKGSIQQTKRSNDLVIDLKGPKKNCGLQI